MTEESKGDGRSTGAVEGIRWFDWSAEPFELARDSGKLVLLDLTATWCHWCHVMDETTYSDPRVVAVINRSFVPVRVDIDRRPDVSERYNRGGFPTTAFLSDKGESIWGATYIPPVDMLRIMDSLLNAKAAGEIDRALERLRNSSTEERMGQRSISPVSYEQMDDMFEDLFATYDLENGGFGTAPKFPQPDMLDLVLTRYLWTSDEELGDAVISTLERMVAGLYDGVEGGIFRYSVTADWMTPHYEKMLETNAGFLRNLLHVKLATGTDAFDPVILGTIGYINGTLRDDASGGFYASQDADEEYYSLNAQERRKRSPPRVDRTMYAGWNAMVAKALVLAGKVLSDKAVGELGLRTFEMVSSRLMDSDLGLVRHAEDQELHIFEDQVAYLDALLGVMELTGDGALNERAVALVTAVEREFAHPDGGFGDIRVSPDAIGALDTPLRSPVDNARWAMSLIRLAAMTNRSELLAKAEHVLDSFGREELDAYGVLIAEYITARSVLARGAVTVEIHMPEGGAQQTDALWMGAKSACDPGTVISRVRDDYATKPFAVVCSRSGCSGKLHDAEEVRERVLAEVRKLFQEAQSATGTIRASSK
ncbi:MAG: DUF255 domain-containing protein [Thermoplasmata archaeon]